MIIDNIIGEIGGLGESAIFIDMDGLGKAMFTFQDIKKLSDDSHGRSFAGRAEEPKHSGGGIDEDKHSGKTMERRWFQNEKFICKYFLRAR